MPSAVQAHLRHLGEDLAAPAHDLGALKEAVRAARVRSVRKKASVQARLDAAGVAHPKSREHAMKYEPPDTLYLWWLARPDTPVFIGELSIVRAMQGALAQAEVRRVCTVVAGWREHFAAAGVVSSDLDQLVAMIDRPFLREQRRAFVPD